MAVVVNDKKAHFTFIWTIENASSIQSSKTFSSPMFTTDSEVMQKTKWHLAMDPETDWITFFVRRLENDGGPDTIEIDYEISLLSGDGYSLVKKMERKRFKNSSIFALRRLVSLDEVFSERKEEFLPKDRLTIHCKMWRTNCEVSKGDLQYVRTRKKIHRMNFVWAIKNFSTLRKNEKRIHIVKPTSKMVPQLILTFYLQESLGKEHAIIHFDKDAKPKCHLIHGKVCLLDANGKVRHSVESQDYISLDDETYWLSKTAYPKSQIIANKESLLPNDVLTFRCVFEIDTEPFCCQIETYKDFNSSNLEYILSEVPEIQFEDSPDASPLQQFLTDCFNQGTLSDVCLRAGSESFHVHKLILSVFSPVFKNMFSNDKTKTFVDVHNVDADTMRLLLSYIYMNNVPVLEWEKTAQLFIASDTYEMLDLREKCCTFLISSLTINNCCNIIKIADAHNDQTLRTVVYGFMMKHNAEVFKSETWEDFKKESFTLAMDTTERIICLMKNREK